MSTRLAKINVAQVYKTAERWRCEKITNNTSHSNNLHSSISMYKPKAREEYIAQCRYYDGTDKEREGEAAMFAFYEACWVDMHYPNANELKAILSDYKLHKLGHFNDGDGVPITLKALLWSRYCHWNGYPNDDENFKVFYREQYLKSRPVSS